MTAMLFITLLYIISMFLCVFLFQIKQPSPPIILSLQYNRRNKTEKNPQFVSLYLAETEMKSDNQQNTSHEKKTV